MLLKVLPNHHGCEQSPGKPALEGGRGLKTIAPIRLNSRERALQKNELTARPRDACVLYRVPRPVSRLFRGSCLANGARANEGPLQQLFL